MIYRIDYSGVFKDVRYFAIVDDEQCHDGGSAAEWLTIRDAEWLVDMLNTNSDVAQRVLAFIADNPDASWTAIRMGWAMTEGATYAQAARAVRGAGPSC